MTLSKMQNLPPLQDSVGANIEMLRTLNDIERFISTYPNRLAENQSSQPFTVKLIDTTRMYTLGAYIDRTILSIRNSPDAKYLPRNLELTSQIVCLVEKLKAIEAHLSSIQTCFNKISLIQSL